MLVTKILNRDVIIDFDVLNDTVELSICRNKEDLKRLEEAKSQDYFDYSVYADDADIVKNEYYNNSDFEKLHRMLFKDDFSEQKENWSSEEVEGYIDIRLGEFNDNKETIEYLIRLAGYEIKSELETPNKYYYLIFDPITNEEKELQGGTLTEIADQI